MLEILAQTTQAAGDGGAMSVVLFYLFAALVVAGALAVALSGNLKRAALGLLVVLAAMAGLFLLLHAEFLAAVQLLVFIGATAAIMLVGFNLAGGRERQRSRRAELIVASLIACMIAFSLAFLFVQTPWRTVESPNAMNAPTVDNVGTALLSSHGPAAYLVPFELLSLLLLTVLVGAAYLARPRRPAPTTAVHIETLSPSHAALERSKR